MINFLAKLWYCWIKGKHEYLEIGHCNSLYFGEFKVYRCKKCNKIEIEKGPFPPEHVDCRCTIKEGENYE